MIGLAMEFILIGFGNVVTALWLATPKSSIVYKDLNEKRNAKMLPAWSWPGHSAWAPIQDLADFVLVLVASAVFLVAP